MTFSISSDVQENGISVQIECEGLTTELANKIRDNTRPFRKRFYTGALGLLRGVYAFVETSLHNVDRQHQREKQ